MPVLANTAHKLKVRPVPWARSAARLLFFYAAHDAACRCVMKLIKWTVLLLACSLALPGNPVFGFGRAEAPAPVISELVLAQSVCTDYPLICIGADHALAGIRIQLAFLADAAHGWLAPAPPR